jgi:hypothetical protein
LIRIAYDSRETIVKTIPIEDPGKTFCKNGLDTIEFDHKSSMFSTGALTEVKTPNNEVPSGHYFRETRPLVFKEMLREFREI